MRKNKKEAAWIFSFSIEHRDEPKVRQEVLDKFLAASNSWAAERSLETVSAYYGESEFTGTTYREWDRFLRQEMKKSLHATFES